MANTIILKRSSTPSKVPTTAQLALGEIAINTHDGKIFIKKDSGVPTVVEIGGVTSVNTQTGDVVLSTSDVAEGSNEYFTTARARGALSAGTGISYNSGTGVISTTQNLSTAGTPTFAGATVAGDLTVRHIIPSLSNTYDLGSAANPFRHMYVGPGSLYVNGKQVLTESSGTMTFTADLDQNMRVTTTGTGLLQFGSSTTGVNIDGTLQIAAGKRITSSDGVKVQFGDDVELNNNKVIGLGTPTALTDAATKGYVDGAISAISTSTITQGNSSVQVVDSGTGTVTVTVDGNTALTVTSSGVVIAGNMTVEGTTTSVNSNTISLADNIVTLNSDATGIPTQNAGIEVERGDEANVQMRWNEGLQKWTFTNDGSVYTQIATSTDTLAEGTTQLFHSATRARAAISASTSSGVNYNSASGLISLGSIPNSSLTNNSITVNGAVGVLGGSITLGVADISGAATTTSVTAAIATAATDATTKANAAQAAATSAAATDATTKANAAQVAAAATAATDATTKANAAQAAAIAAAATDATAKVAAEATARDAAIAAAVASKDNLDEIDEGQVNLYFTDARAVSANTSAIATAKSEAISSATSTAATDATSKANAAQAAAISAAATDATSKVATAKSEAISAAATDATSKVATAKSEAISAAATDATSKVAAEATARDTAIATAKSQAISAAATDATSKANSAQSNAASDATTKVAAETNRATAAEALLAPKASPTFTGTVSGVTKAMVGLSAVDNTADSAKPVSTAQATAIATAKSEAISSAAADATTKANNAQAAAISSAATDATSKANSAQAAAISAAAADATTKANAAQAAAIAAVTNGAGAAFDTLKEIQDAMATDAELSAAISGLTIGNGTMTVSAGSGMTGGGSFTANQTGNSSVTLSHADTSSVASLTALTGANVVSDIDFDTYGHVTGIATRAMTLGDLGYTGATNANYITNTNQLTNGAGYVTSSGVTSVATGNGLTGGTITSTGTLSLSGSYSGTWAVTGGITATGEITAYYSDINLKKDIVEIQDPIAKVMSLRGVTFRPNQTALDLGIVDKEEVGVIAQEVEAVLPQLVTPSAFAGFKTVKYDKLTALLLEAVKAQQLQIDALKAEISKLGGSATTEL